MVADSIEREIFIQAGIEHVWSLVSRAGFWIGDELHFEVEAVEGDLATIETKNYGSFPVHVHRLTPPHYAAYRWASSVPGVVPTEKNSTLVEFKLTEQDGGVLVRLKESGFFALMHDSIIRDAAYNDNLTGWEMQLQRLARIAEGAAV